MTALVTTIIEAVLKSSVILALTFLATLALRRQSAALRHTVWTAGLLCSLALPLFSLVMPAWHVEPIRVVQYSTNVTAPQPVVTESGMVTVAPPSTIPSTPNWLTPERVLLLIWLTGILLVASLLLREIVRLARVAFGASTVHEFSWRELTREVSQALRLARHVRLMRNPNASVLGTWGTLRPRVLLPRESESWPSERMRVVLGHELAHVKRNDWLVQVIAELARAIYWFNPLFWIACTHLRRESEHACDDTAMRLGVELGIDGPTYAAHVLDLARTLKHSGQPRAAALAMASPSNLERRLIAMLNPSLNRRVTGIRTTVIVVLLALTLTLPIAAMQSTETDFRATIRANSSVINDGKVQFRGNVEMTADSVILTSDELNYDPTKQPLEAHGNVKVKSGQDKGGARNGSTSKAEFEIASSSMTLSLPLKTSRAPAVGAAEAAQPTVAQNPTGTLSGTVSDPSGAVVPGVRVNMTAQSTGMTRRTLTNEAGNFAFGELPPDNYAGTVELAGFHPGKFSYVLADPGSSARLRFTMQIASMSTTVSITAQAPPGLKCFSIVGAVKSDGTPFTEADCPGGTIVVGSTPKPPAQLPADPNATNGVAVFDTLPAVAAPPALMANGRPYPIRVGGDIQAGNLLYHPSPAYPSEARIKGIEGVVIVSGIISVDGRLQSLRITSSSNPLLETSVTDSLQNWIYKPVLLNKYPVEVMTTITLNFTLGR